MVPPTYNANLQILQSSDLVLIRHEMMHDVRMIYLDGRPHPPPSLQWLAGHSVGRFEGQTLVVDTTNFTALTNFRGSPRIRGRTSSRASACTSSSASRAPARTPSTTRSRWTIRIPGSSPWSGEMEMRSVDGPIYEYACHEGNLGLANILRAARVAERR